MGLGRAIKWFDTIAADHPKALKYFDEYAYHPYRDDIPEKRIWNQLHHRQTHKKTLGVRRRFEGPENFGW
jgi:hypothetical protein